MDNKSGKLLSATTSTNRASISAESFSCPPDERFINQATMEPLPVDQRLDLASVGALGVPCEMESDFRRMIDSLHKLLAELISGLARVHSGSA